jgi:rubrerythrin
LFGESASEERRSDRRFAAVGTLPLPWPSDAPDLEAGGRSRVDLSCTSCGYGVVVRIAPERCPMCSSSAWTQR